MDEEIPGGLGRAYPWQPGKPPRLHSFLDLSMVEAHDGGRGCPAARTCPTGAHATGLAVWAHGGGASLRSLEAWDMRSIWPRGEG